MLFNPYTNYLYYLAGSLIPTMFHMFVLLMSVFALGTELKYGTAGELWRLSGESCPVAVAGKLLPYTVIFSIDALLMHALLFSYCGIPLRGSAALILLATFMMILAYQALGVFLITVTANIRLALMAAPSMPPPPTLRRHDISGHGLSASGQGVGLLRAAEAFPGDLYK